MNKEVKDAANKFEAEFDFSEMDTMIHRFPAALGNGMPSMVAPKLVTIGPYHHGNKDLEKLRMEEVKNAATYYLCQRIDVKPEIALKALLADDTAVVDKALSKYHDIAVVDDDDGTASTGTMTKTNFAAMMLRDACFLLVFMDAHSRFYGNAKDYQLNKSMRGFLFTHRDSISNDIFLLENQLPWLVIQFLLGLASQEDTKKKKLVKAVGKFIAAMGNSFKMLESSDDLTEYKWDDHNNPPAHLLDLLRRHKIEIPPADDKTGGHNNNNNSETTGSSSILANRNNTTSSVVVQVGDDGGSGNSSTRHLHRPLILPAAVAHGHEEKPQVPFTSLSAMSPMDLEEIGIKLADNRTAAFSDMGLKKHLLFLRHLTLAPLSLSDTRASCLVNMAALEICTASRFGDDAGSTAVCSYLALLAFFMVVPEDVRRLRSMGLLHGPHGDGDMIAFFNNVVRHLPDSGKQFALIMADIEKYKRTRPVSTMLYKWVYRYGKTVIGVISTIFALIGFYKTFISLFPTN